jgi:hypothetical protein
VTNGQTDDPATLDMAVKSLALALHRHDEARQRMVLLDAFASAAETVWWICAIDEQLGGKGSQYAAARDADDAGRYIAGLRWVRNRHTHQLPITTEEDTTPFFASRGADYLLFVSPGFIWRPSVDIRGNPDRDDRREIYDELMAGIKTSLPLHNACAWLERQVGQEIRHVHLPKVDPLALPE